MRYAGRCCCGRRLRRFGGGWRCQMIGGGDVQARRLWRLKSPSDRSAAVDWAAGHLPARRIEDVTCYQPLLALHASNMDNDSMDKSQCVVGIVVWRTAGHSPTPVAQTLSPELYYHRHAPASSQRPSLYDNNTAASPSVPKKSIIRPHMLSSSSPPYPTPRRPA